MKTGARYWAMIGVLLAAVGGMGFLSHGEATPMAKPLSDFPKQVAGYTSIADMPLAPKELEALGGVTDYVNRWYASPSQGALSLFIEYFVTQRTGATIHSPKNCLPGAGWQPVQSGFYQLKLDDGRSVPINLYLIRKDLEEQVVLYWYQSHGRVVASEYWGKFYLVYDALRLNRTDAALVRIVTPVVGGDEEAARTRAITFAKQITTDVDKVIPR
jgi:EpsI family protein